MTEPGHLEEVLQDIQRLVGDPRFGVDLAQVRAKAISAELGGGDTGIQFKFDPTQVWSRCDLIFSEASRILRDNPTAGEQLLQEVLQAAQAFEFLSKTADEGDQEKLLLSAAICYHIAGYQANAQCLARSVETECFPSLPRTDEGLDAALIDLFRFSLVAFLKRDITELSRLVRDSREPIDQIRSRLLTMIGSQESDFSGVAALLAHSYYYEFLRSFASYCETGVTPALERAGYSLEKSYRYFEKLRDVTPSVLTAELRTALQLFAERNTWYSIRSHSPALLEDPTWSLYLRNLAVDKSIVEFWTSQLKALKEGILLGSDSFVIQMPTSAGKTLIAELTILAALTREQGSHCLYIAPYRALVNEIHATLSEDLGAVGFRVSTLLGGFDFDDLQGFLLTESDVLIATPEKTELLLRTHPEYFDNVDVVVVDEGHIIDEGIPEPADVDGDLIQSLSRQGSIGRGVVLELLITRLKRRRPRTRFLYLSAVMPEVNAQDFVDWLSESKQGLLRIDARERPARLVIARFRWRSGRNGELQYSGLRRLATGQYPFVPYFIERKQYLTGEQTPTGLPQRRSWPNTSNKAQTTAMLAVRFAKSGPVLVFCAQKSGVRAVVEALLTSLKYLEASDELNYDDLRLVRDPNLPSYECAMEWLGPRHPLTKALRHRVGLHYGPLPEPVRQAVEEDFREGRIRILVSTNTLGQGVNMPVRTALVHSLERRWLDKSQNEVRTAPVKKRDFLNICGRAGRAGRETEGLIVFVTVSPRDQVLFNKYRRATAETLESALYQLLRLLTDQRLSNADLIGYLDPFVLAILAEEVVDTTDEREITAFLGRSLVGVQALRQGTDLAPLAKAFVAVSAWVTSTVPDPGQQRAFASTCLRVESCQSLQAAVEEFAAKLSSDWAESRAQARDCDTGLLHVAFDACRDLPEMHPSGATYKFIVGHEYNLVAAWVRGTPIERLREHHWSREHPEEFGQYIGDRATYRLPWGVNAFLSLLAFTLEVDFQKLPLAWRHLASMVKYGVDDVVACWARDLGVPRNLALRVAHEYSPERTLSFAEFLKWIGNLPVESVLHMEGSSAQKRRFLERIVDLVPSRDLLRIIRSGTRVLSSPVRGIPYENRQAPASLAHEGDTLDLELEPDNPYDRYAIRVLLGQAQIGYVQRDIAKIVSSELRRGRQVRARVHTVRAASDQYPYPWIEMRIDIV